MCSGMALRAASKACTRSFFLRRVGRYVFPAEANPVAASPAAQCPLPVLRFPPWPVPGGGLEWEPENAARAVRARGARTETPPVYVN